MISEGHAPAGTGAVRVEFRRQGSGTLPPGQWLLVAASSAARAFLRADLGRLAQVGDDVRDFPRVPHIRVVGEVCDHEARHRSVEGAHGAPVIGAVTSPTSTRSGGG